MYYRMAGLLTVVAIACAAGCSRQVTYTGIAPLLKDRCAVCHTGAGAGLTNSGFSVESYETIMHGTRLGPVVVPGSAESSTLYLVVAGKTDPKIHMPQSADPLTGKQIALIKAWIDQGARK